MNFVTTHKKIHIAELWRLPDCGAPYSAATYYNMYEAAVEAGKFPAGTVVNFSVPAVGRGLLLAALEAKKSGLPVNRFLLASNENRVLTDFFRTGVYAPQPPQPTEAPLLDVGAYPEAEALGEVPPAELAETFAAYACPARRYRNMKEKVREAWGVTLANSTAVAYVALQDHRCVTADGLHAILLSLEEPE